MTDTTSQDAPVLQVTDLSVDFAVDRKWIPAAIDVSYEVHAGEVLAIVGESGSGKSVSSMALLGLLPKNARITGSIKLMGQEMSDMSVGEGAGDPRQRHRDDLPGADDGAEPGLHDRRADHRGPAAAQHDVAGATPATGRSSCSRWSSCPTRSRRSTPTRTSSRAASGSAR